MYCDNRCNKLLVMGSSSICISGGPKVVDAHDDGIGLFHKSSEMLPVPVCITSSFPHRTSEYSAY